MDLVEEQDAPVGRAEETGPGSRGTGEGTARMAKQRRHRLIAAEGGAVHLDEIPPHLLAAALEIVDPPR